MRGPSVTELDSEDCHGWVADRYEDGSAYAPGEKLETDINDELLEPLFKAPQMNRLIIGGEKKKC